MYCPGAFAVDAIEALHAAIRARVLATLAVADGDGIEFAYAPVVVDAVGVYGRLRFHLARSNPMADRLDGARVKVSFLGPDGYVSPDWYVGAGFVPTWNYVAIEGEGIATRLTGAACETAIADLSAQEEARLAPKPAWTLDKLSPARQAQLRAAIAVFALPLSRLEGKFKLSQDKSAADRAGVVAALASQQDPRSQGLVDIMNMTVSR